MSRIKENIRVSAENLRVAYENLNKLYTKIIEIEKRKEHT